MVGISLSEAIDSGRHDSLSGHYDQTAVCVGTRFQIFKTLTLLNLRFYLNL